MIMSPHVPQPVSDHGPPRFYPVQFHPEFGYLAPTLRFRSKLSLLGKGAAFGLVVGIIVAIAVSPDRQERVRSRLSMQSEAATSDWPATAPVRFVTATTPTPAPVVEPMATLPEPAARPQNAMPKPKKKIARQSRQRRSGGQAESDPRSAYAGPSRRNPEPQSGWNGGRPFGFGW
jgi:hypothetical protein